MEDSTKDSSILSNSSGNKPSLDENPIKQVINTVHEADTETGKEKSNKPELLENVGTENRQNDVKAEIGYQHSQGTSENASEEKVTQVLVIFLSFSQSSFVLCAKKLFVQFHGLGPIRNLFELCFSKF